MNRTIVKKYWPETYQVFYDSYYNELILESLSVKLERANVFMSMLIMATASGSAIAGWALWDRPGFKTLWAVLAAVASVAAIASNALQLPQLLKTYGNLHGNFSQLRLELQHFAYSLHRHVTEEEAEKELEEFHRRYAAIEKRTTPGIFVTRKLKEAKQGQLDEILKQRGFVKS